MKLAWRAMTLLAGGIAAAGCYLTDLGLDGFAEGPDAGLSPSTPSELDASTADSGTTPKDGGHADPDASALGAIRREAHSSVENTTALATVTVTAPDGTVSGDLLVACLALNGVSATTTPSGWTAIAAVTAIGNPHVFGYFHVVGGPEPSAYTWALSGSATSSAGIVRYTGVDRAAPVGIGVQASNATQTTATLPSVTTDAANAVLVGCVGANSSNADLAIAPPAGFTEVWNLLGKRQELADSPLPLAGPTGDKIWAFSSTREWAGWLTFLRPKR